MLNIFRDLRGKSVFTHSDWFIGSFTSPRLGKSLLTSLIHSKMSLDVVLSLYFLIVFRDFGPFVNETLLVLLLYPRPIIIFFLSQVSTCSCKFNFRWPWLSSDTSTLQSSAGVRTFCRKFWQDGGRDGIIEVWLLASISISI